MEAWNGKGLDEILAQSSEISLRKRDIKAKEKESFPKVTKKRTQDTEWEEFGACVMKKSRIERDKEEFLKEKQNQIQKQLSEISGKCKDIV